MWGKDVNPGAELVKVINKGLSHLDSGSRHMSAFAGNSTASAILQFHAMELQRQHEHTLMSSQHAHEIAHTTLQGQNEIAAIRARGAQERANMRLQQRGAQDAHARTQTAEADAHARTQAAEEAAHARRTSAFSDAVGFVKGQPAGSHTRITLPDGTMVESRTPSPHPSPEEETTDAPKRTRRKKGDMIEDPMFTEKGNIPKKLL